MNIQKTSTPDTFTNFSTIFLESKKLKKKKGVIFAGKKTAMEISHRFAQNVDLLGKTQLPNEDPSQAAALGRWLVDPTGPLVTPTLGRVTLGLEVYCFFRGGVENRMSKNDVVVFWIYDFCWDKKAISEKEVKLNGLK